MVIQILVRTALLHGQEFVSHWTDSSEIEWSKISQKISLYDQSSFNLFANLDETINFDVRILNLHRCTRLLICLLYTNKKRRVTTHTHTHRQNFLSTVFGY